MGHVVNPIAFRLGEKKVHKVHWQSGYYGGHIGSQYIYYLKEDFFIIKFLKGIFFKHTIPLYTKTERRNYIDTEKNELIMPGEAGIIKNLFINMSIFLSHIFIGRGVHFNISIFLYDKGIEEMRNAYKLYRERSVPNKILSDNLRGKGRFKHFSNLLGKLRKIHKLHVIIKKNKKHILKKANINRLKQKYYYIKQTDMIRRKYFSERILTYAKRLRGKWRNPNPLTRKRIPRFKYLTYYKKFSIKYFYPKMGLDYLTHNRSNIIPAKLNDIYKLNTKKLKFKNICKQLKIFLKLLTSIKNSNSSLFILKIILILLQLLNQFLIDVKFRKLYTSDNAKHINDLLSEDYSPIFINLKPYYRQLKYIQFHVIIKKLYILLKIKEAELFIFRNLHTSLVYKYRYYIMMNTAKIIFLNLKLLNILPLIQQKQLSSSPSPITTNPLLIMINFIGYHSKNITPSLITNFIIYRLSQYIPINPILNEVIYWIKRANQLQGFKIVVAGRLTRKERAAHIVKIKGKIPYSTKTQAIEYYNDFKIMRFGVVGIKVWFVRKQHNPINLYKKNVNKHKNKNRGHIPGYYYFNFSYNNNKELNFKIK
jgi:hypothetical protein